MYILGKHTEDKKKHEKTAQKKENNRRNMTVTYSYIYFKNLNFRVNDKHNIQE